MHHADHLSLVALPLQDQHHLIHHELNEIGVAAALVECCEGQRTVALIVDHAEMFEHQVVGAVVDLVITGCREDLKIAAPELGRWHQE